MAGTAITQRKKASLDRRGQIAARLGEFRLVAALILLAGIFASFSTTVYLRIAKEVPIYNDFFQHLYFIAAGLFLSLVMVQVMKRGGDTRRWMQYVIPGLLLLSLILVAMVHIPGLGVGEYGATRRLNVGWFTFQPSELLKILLVMFLAQLLCWGRKPFEPDTEGQEGRRKPKRTSKLHPVFANAFNYVSSRNSATWPDLPRRCIIIVALAVGLTAPQPDLGSSFILLGASLITIIIAGVHPRHIAYCVVLLFMIGLGVLVVAPENYEYVKARFYTWQHPLENPDSTSYQLNEGKMAVAEGRIWGKGPLKGDQKMKRVPLSTKDFVFPVIVEELGFVGGVGIMGLFAALALVSMRLSYSLQDPFNRTVVASLGLTLCFQGFVNIGTTIGYLPLSGLTLPFFSEGGTSLMVSILALGMMYALAVSEQARVTRPAAQLPATD